MLRHTYVIELMFIIINAHSYMSRGIETRCINTTYTDIKNIYNVMKEEDLVKDCKTYLIDIRIDLSTFPQYIVPFLLSTDW